MIVVARWDEKLAWEIVVGRSGGYALVGSSDENADIHRLLPLPEEPECDSSIWIGSSEDIRERTAEFRKPTSSRTKNPLISSTYQPSMASAW